MCLSLCDDLDLRGQSVPPRPIGSGAAAAFVHLDRRAGNIAKGTVDAAITRLRTQHGAASLAIVEKLASVGRHFVSGNVAAFRAGQRRVGQDRIHRPYTQRISSVSKCGTMSDAAASRPDRTRTPVTIRDGLRPPRNARYPANATSAKAAADNQSWLRTKKRKWRSKAVPAPRLAKAIGRMQQVAPANPDNAASAPPPANTPAKRSGSTGRFITWPRERSVISRMSIMKRRASPHITVSSPRAHNYPAVRRVKAKKRALADLSYPVVQTLTSRPLTHPWW